MPLPVVLTIAGSDNSCGAGAQADLKTISALGGYALTAITCVVAEIPGKVSTIHPIPPEIVSEQIRLCFEAFPVAAVKTGMLYSRDIIQAVAGTLSECMRASASRPRLVIDPVMVATSGDPLLRDDAVALYREALFPIAALITPNLDEVRTLLGRSVDSEVAMREAGLELASSFGCAVLIKGGHLRQDVAVDYLVEGDRIEDYRAPFVPEVSTHGTGCSYSAAIATELARGSSLRDSVAAAKKFVSRAITNYLRWERGGCTIDALHHFVPR
jgi:hydroxymethylpyrimidine/phosphomethylpyrimidine kinase